MPERDHVKNSLIAMLLGLCGLFGCQRSKSSGAVDAKASIVELMGPSPIADGTDRANLVVRVHDGSGRAIAGQIVQLSVTGDGNVTNQPGLTGSDGAASGWIASTLPETKTVTVTVNPGPHAVMLSKQITIPFLPIASGTRSTLTVGSTTLPANGTSKARITVTVRDTKGQPAAGHTVRLAATGSATILTQPTATTDVNGVATGFLASTVAGVKTITATVNPNHSAVVVSAVGTVTFTADPLGPDDVEFYYGEGVASEARLRTWADTTSQWAAEAKAPATGTGIRWTINAFAPTNSFERLVGVLSDDGTATDLDLLRWDGASWSTDWSSNGIARVDVDKRGFDLAYEDSSGDALAVYSNGTKTPVFRTLSAGVWSAEQPLPINDGAGPLPDPNSGVVYWIELAPRRGSNEIALAYADANADLVALTWSGTSWSTATVSTLTTTLAINGLSHVVHNRAFDLAYETTSGQLVVAWGNETGAGFWFSRKPAGSNLWTTKQHIVAQNGIADFVDLEAEPVGNRIAAGFFDMSGTERLGLAVWDGTNWLNAGEYDSQTRDVNHTAQGDMPGAVGWVGTSGVAVCVYSDNAPARIDWKRWTAAGGWTNQTHVGVSGKGFTESVALHTFRTQSKLMVVVSGSNSNLYAATYNGTAWTMTNGAQPLETSISSLASRPFSFDPKTR